MAYIDIIVVGLPVVVAIILVLFFNGIDKDIIEKRDKLYPKIAKCIENEFKKYQKAEEPVKENIISKIITLDIFRRNLRKTRTIRNYGFLYTFVSVIVVIILLVVIPYVPLHQFLSTSTTLKCYPILNATNNMVSCSQLSPSLSAIIFLFVAEIGVFVIIFTYSKFVLLWKMSKVIIQNIDEKNKDVTDIVCTIFKTKGYPSKSNKS